LPWILYRREVLSRHLSPQHVDCHFKTACEQLIRQRSDSHPKLPNLPPE